jgi:hypothetical protein
VSSERDTRRRDARLPRPKNVDENDGAGRRHIVLRRGFAYVTTVTERWSGELIRSRLWIAIVMLVLTTTNVALAQGARQAEPFRLIWSSSAGCGTARTFLAELAGRTALLREARVDEHAITLIVETFPAAPGVRGQLTVRKPDGDLSVREVPGLSCHEVESAMALIAALMVDPLAAGAEPPATAGLRSTPDSSRDDLAPAAPESGWSLRVEQRLTARTAIAPGLAWGQAVGVMVTREASRLRPSLGLAAHVARSTTGASQGRAELDWAAAQLTFCPLSASPHERWDARACGAFQIGRLRGTGFETANPATKSVVWSSAALQLEVRHRLIGPLWLGLEGAFVLPFSRERFYLEPEPTLHRVPAWGAAFGLGAGLRFL